METILNLVWVGVTIAILWLWRYRWSVLPRDARCNVRQESLALVCLLALLFPVISLSDDLHPEIVAMDAAGGKRHASQILSAAPRLHGMTVGRGNHLTVGRLPFPLPDTTLIFAGVVLQLQFRNPVAVSRSSPGRSPPSLL
jgi:hypothetical protein